MSNTISFALQQNGKPNAMVSLAMPLSAYFRLFFSPMLCLCPPGRFELVAESSQKKGEIAPLQFTQEAAKKN